MTTSSPILALATLLLLLSVTTAEVTSDSTTTSRRLTNHAIRTFLPEDQRQPARLASRRMRAAIQAASACDTTVCFALQGDASLSQQTFQLAQAISALTASVVSMDTDASFAAVQYATLSTAISPLTTNAEQFQYAVGNSTWDGRNDINLAAGLAYCGFQTMAEANARQAVVLIGSGESTSGLAPAQVVPRIIAPEGRGTIYGVSTAGDQNTFVNAVGEKNEKDNLGRVFVLRSTEQIVDVLARLVEQVCDVRVCGASIDADECAPEVSEVPEVSAEEPEPSAAS